MSTAAQPRPGTNSEADLVLQFLRGMRRGKVRVGLNGKRLVAVDAESRQARVDVSAWPTESTLGRMRTPASVTEALRGLSMIPRMARSLNDIDWTVRLDVDGRELAVFGRDGPAVSGHMWVSPNPAILADGVRRLARRLVDGKSSSSSD